MDTVSDSPDIAKCIGCGADIGVADDLGLITLCPACEQSHTWWEAHRTIGDTVSIVLGRGNFACLSVEDRQDLLHQLHAGIGPVPQALPAEEAKAFDAPQSAPPAPFIVHGEVTITWRTLEEAKQSVDRFRAVGMDAHIKGFLY